jgi:hypothetical protein
MHLCFVFFTILSDGPLTFDQLKHNLPTKISPPEKLQHVLDILVVIGLLSIVDEEKTIENLGKVSRGESISSSSKESKGGKNKSSLSPSLSQAQAIPPAAGASTSTANANPSATNANNETSGQASAPAPTPMDIDQERKTNEAKAPSAKQQKEATATSTSTTIPTIKRYVYLNGTPRFDNMQVVPNHLLKLLDLSTNEIKDATERIKLLRQQLIRPAPARRQTAHHFFQSTMFETYPYLTQDPLYTAAMDNVRKARAAMAFENGLVDSSVPSPSRDRKGRLGL